MPAKSRAQFKKMIALYKEGKIDKDTLKDYTSVSYAALPDKLSKNKGRVIKPKKRKN